MLASLGMVGASAVLFLAAPSPTAEAAVAPGSTVRASVRNANSAEDPDGGESSTLSGDGNSVAFVSEGRLDNLEPNRFVNVFVRDLVRNRTVQISRGQFTPPPPPPLPTTTTPTFDPPSFGGEPLLNLNGAAQQNEPEEPTFGETPANGDSFDPTISADGRYVAFATTARNILVGDQNRDLDILLCDRDPDADGDYDERGDNGAVDYVYYRVSIPVTLPGPSAVAAPSRIDWPSNPKLSADAGRIVWESNAYVADVESVRPRLRTAVLRSAATGQIGAPVSTEEVPSPIEGARLIDQVDPAISGDGQHIAMRSNYSVRSCPPGTDSCLTRYFNAIMTTDLRTGQSTRVDVEPGGGRFVSTDESIFVMWPSLSFDGSVVAFEAELYESVYDGGDGSYWAPKFRQPNVYVVQLDAASQPVDSIIASKNTAGDLVNGAKPAVSADGRYLAFVTDALATHDGVDRSTVRSNCFGRHEETVDFSGDNLLSFAAALPSPDQSRDVRTVCQVVVRDLVLDRERLVSEQQRLPATLASPGLRRDCARTLPADATCASDDDSTPIEAYRGHSSPSLSTDGGRVSFESIATDLVPDDNNDVVDVFVRTFQPSLTADPNPLEFGQVTIGESANRTTTLDHVGAGPLFVQDITIEGPNADDFELSAQTCTGRAVHQLKSCLAGVLFTPEATGDRRAQLVIQIRGAAEPLRVDLHGVGFEEPIPPPQEAEFAAGPNPLDFGPRLLLSDGPDGVVTVTNNGGSPLQITNVSIEPVPSPGDFTVAGNGCTGVAVPPGGQCTVSVGFSPIIPGDRVAVLRFDDNALGGPHLIALRGSAGEPTIEVNPGVTQPGRVTQVTGAGFPPGKTVTVTFTDPIGSSVETRLVQPDGTFKLQLLIFPKSTIGVRQVLATVNGVLPAIAAPPKPLLIVSPTVGPAAFVIRG